jgi:hypothetical protein
LTGLLGLVYRRALAASTSDPSLLQLGFDVAVLDRYRGEPSYRVIRTNTVGRLKKQGGWTIDFGIAPGETAIHASWRDVSRCIPEGEREHWAQHAAPLAAVSEMYIRMQLSPGSCFDDGELRAW